MRKSCVLIFILFSIVFGQIPSRKGWWKFDDPASLNKAEAGYGGKLESVGVSITAGPGPESSNGAAHIGIGSYFKMIHGIAKNGGGAYVNEYTLQIDFKVSALGVWHCFFQTNAANANDGDCFINPYGNIGVGATGYSGSAIKPGEWYRLVVTVKNEYMYNCYLDGRLLFSGTPQGTDGRFSLDPVLLVFADENGEDGPIDCAELAIWDLALSASEVNDLGGYGHKVASPDLMTRIPYLQAPAPNSIQVCWHDSSASPSHVEYGLSPDLGQTAAAANELLGTPYRWHTAKLADLQAGTLYHYRVVSGDGPSPLYTFKTLPEPGFDGKLRILLLSDTHSGDSTMVNRVVRAAKGKIEQLYGSDLANQLHLVLHSGDIVVSGGSLNHYTDQYFRPMAPLSPWVPFMVTTGNHEGENAYYYKYMKYEDLSGVAPPSVFAEKFWSFTAGNSLFIGLNTNIVSEAGTLQKTFLDTRLYQAERDSAIDFVFISFHHLPYSELWVEGVTNDAGSAYIRNVLFPVIKKYSKVQQLTYGHTHAFERGTIESPLANGDFRIVCAGGGGGSTDNWGEFQNTDHPWIHIALDHYFFQILEIDAANRSYEISMYSLGNESKSRNVQLMDRWYRKLQQSGPDTPVTSIPIIQDSDLLLNCSPFSGGDSLMTIRIQIAEDADFAKVQIDTLVHWKNIYGVDANYEPVDTNAGIDLTRIKFSRMRFINVKPYYYRVKYRDHNLMWSEWSNKTLFTVATGIEESRAAPIHFELAQNYPNPFNNHTIIAYQIPKTTHVSLKLYNVLGQSVFTLVNGEKSAGNYQVELDAGLLSSGLYYYEMKSDEFKAKKSLNLAK